MTKTWNILLGFTRPYDAHLPVEAETLDRAFAKAAMAADEEDLWSGQASDRPFAIEVAEGAIAVPVPDRLMEQRPGVAGTTQTSWIPADAVALEAPHAAGERNFDGKDLSWIDLSRASFKGASFRNTRLGETNLSGANCDGADFTGANLDNATLDGVSFRGAILKRADLPRARMFAARFDKAHLEKACLRNAIASEAVFAWAHMRGASLADASFTEVDLDQIDRRTGGVSR